MLLYSARHSHNTTSAGRKHYYRLVTRYCQPRLAWYSPARYMEQLRKTFYWGQTYIEPLWTSYKESVTKLSFACPTTF